MLNLRLTIILLLVLCANGLAASREGALTFVCAPNNDVYVALKNGGARPARFDSATDAIHRAASNSAVLILADGYPTNTTRVDAALLELAAQKKLSLYLEFPETVPGLTVGAPRKATWERGVVNSDAFIAPLRMQLLALHECHFVPVEHTNALLSMARVAGYDSAIFGLPKENFPLLFELPERRMLVATTKLSSFISARYAPTRDWQRIWDFILRRLDSGGAPHHMGLSPVASASFNAMEKLPRGFESQTVYRAARWINNSRLLVAPARQSTIAQLLVAGKETTPLPPRYWSVGNGSMGILEGYASGIQFDGTQLQRLPLRADCQAESAMVLAADAAFKGRTARGASVVASNLLDYTYFKSGMCQGVRADPKHPAFGLIGWGDIAPAWTVANYGDDNARTILSTILVAAWLKTNRWDEPVAKALLANFRTTGKLGFRGDRIDVGPLEKSGWKAYWDAAPVNYSPHFEAGLWACNLWAYRQTGYRPLLDRTTNAIAMTMQGYPAKWRWQDNMERARMVLCLAWLVQLNDTEQHRAWLAQVTNDLLKQQQPSGALYEQYHVTDGGHYRIPKSNEEYGTTETPLIQANGDPVSDQLYGSGFVLFGLHEAVAATDNLEWKRAEDKLAEFICRIQIRSQQPWLDGWWFRAFDDQRWESWASSADIGWGAWSLEAGWGQAWSVATLALREKKTDFWQFTAKSQVAKPFAKWREQMLEK